ncbi:MAG: GTP cyclohydrolase 1 [Candidatus Omnitrophica bacterium ADurb.Bin277]|nr:MAG: GTP cyclohydrolase 1 [Candidatus Omnitrophica bacterium ADurb.Bin277]
MTMKNVGTKKSEEDKFQKLVGQMLIMLGEDPTREGLQRTPLRVSRSLRYLTEGYKTDPREILAHAVFKEPYDEMVIVKDIEIFSLCEHHLLPFYGKAHIAYIPNGKIIGLSKIPRLVEVFSRRLQVQERLTTQIAESLMSALKPKGVAVVIEALHLCMCMRGVKKSDTYTITSSMLGAFRRDARSRTEFLSLIRLKREE